MRRIVLIDVLCSDHRSSSVATRFRCGLWRDVGGWFWWYYGRSISTQGKFDCVKKDGIEDLHVVVLYCVDVVLGSGQRQSHVEKLSLVTYHYSLFQVSGVSPKLPLYSLRPFSISLLL